MRFTKYNPGVIEPALLQYWKEERVVERLRKRNHNGKKFYFLDGPPYTSGKFHLGHAWNYALKDLVLRYKRMQELNVWDRNGFDVHGLPTEHKVMAKHGLKTKEDIQKYGVDKFVKECEEFCLGMADVMTKDLVRMGVTLDVSNPYMALKTEFMEGEWALIKKAHEEGNLYYGEKVLTWCQHCETAVAKHECEYKNVNEKSIFVKFKVKERGESQGEESKDKEEYLIIWTTTPWTIPFNLAIMVSPDIDYVKIEVKGERWIVAKELAKSLVKGVTGKEELRILEEFKGQELEGIEYIHPFEKYLPQYAKLKAEHPNVHTVILSEQYVDTSAGSGLVHSAPGSGPEDQEACKPYDIPPFNPLKPNGFLPEEMGKFSGMRPKQDDDKFIEALEEENALILTTQYSHEYPHCWRCKHPIIFRVTYQWFFNIEKIKQDILNDNKNVHWVPDTALHAYESWIENLRDNSITRQRYWGTPVPIWRCESCQAVKVMGSREDIKTNGGTPPKNLHIPWIDEVILDCNCGQKMKRTPDIIDVWVDAGTASWNCLDNDPEKIKELYPADFIMEAKEQTRLWFSMLNICSYLYRGERSYQNVYVYGMINDIEGKKMSKSLGNIISPYELIEKHGVDVLRYYMCQNNAGQDINFTWDECVVKERQLRILWNIHQLLLNLAEEQGINPAQLEGKSNSSKLGIEEKYILSKLNSTIEQVTSLMEDYRIDEMIAPLEELFLELSRTYIQFVRDKSNFGSEEEKQVCLWTIFTVLQAIIKMFQIVTPFICEAIYLNLREKLYLEPVSCSHYAWPRGNKNLIDQRLESQVELIKQVIQAALYAREKAKLGVRWPMQELVVVSNEEAVVAAVTELNDLIARQINTKGVRVISELPGIKQSIRLNTKQIGPAFGKLSPQVISSLSRIDLNEVLAEIRKEGAYQLKTADEDNDKDDDKVVSITEKMLLQEREVPEKYAEAQFRRGFVYLDKTRNEELEVEGYAREVMRHIQQLRKEAGLVKSDRINLHLQVSGKLVKGLSSLLDRERVGAAEVEIVTSSSEKEFGHGGKFTIKNENFVASFDKV